MKNLLLIVSMFVCVTSLQAQTISSSFTFTQVTADTYSWPITITGGSSGDPVIVTLAENISLNLVSQYFIIDGEYIIFDGGNKSFTVSNVPNYTGLFRHGTGPGSGFDNIEIKNTKVLSVNSILQSNSGWIAQQYFGYGSTNVIIRNCSSDGEMSYSSGGIAGSYSTCTIMNSHSSGWIYYYGGGIFGAYSSGTAINCYSTGNQDDFCGGIFGSECNGSAQDGYSTGAIGSFSGGIMGAYSSGTATRCYSTGYINSYGGGIAGYEFYGNVAYSYSTGFIGYSAGGIAGENNYGFHQHCYSIGVIDDLGGGITGNNDNGWYSDCYAENSGVWNDDNANGALVNSNDWTDIDLNTPVTPFRLSSFNAILYDPATESLPGNTLMHSPAGNLLTGTYSLISINDASPSSNTTITINSTSGILEYNNTGTGTFTSLVLFGDAADGSYQVNSYTLNILSTLPVTWRSFTVMPRGNTAWLQWSTASEQNSRDFNIQYSTNGSTWATIGTVMASGNSSGVLNYSFLHTTPVNGNNFYRIQQTDMDGNYKYSSVENMKLALSVKSFSVINTLVTNGELQVNVKTSVLLSLYSNDGKMMWQKQFTPGIHSIDLGTISKGVYILKGMDADEKVLVR
jgi:hypothetical protein